MFDVKPIKQRSARGDNRFWATRGKRGLIKPNGFFHPMDGKRSLKPNGLFLVHGGKRSSLKPNSLFALTAKRSNSFKPNSLFALTTGKRSSFKPNIILKPNGLFSLTKRGEAATMPGTFYTFGARHWATPNGLFGAYKRSMKPNGIFNLSKKAKNPEGLMSKKDGSEDDIDLDNEIYEYSYDNDEESQDGLVDEFDVVTDDLEVEEPEKRKENTFWATRGKRSAGF